MFFRMLFSLWLLWSSISYAQTELNNPACVFELGEPSPDTPLALVSFNLPNHLKTPLIDLTRLRIELMQKSASTSLNDFYLGELKKLKEIFLAQGYTEEYFSNTRTFFFHKLSQRNDTLEKEMEVKTSLVQKQKDALYPLKGRTRQVIDAIVSTLQIPEKDITIEDLEKITVLNLTSRNITELRTSDFKGLIHLIELYLGNNQLEGLPETIFQELTLLRELYLNNNRLATLPKNVLQGLGSLEKILLSDNQLAELPETVFWGLSSLRELYLYSNQLTELSENVFRGLGALLELYLNANPIVTISESVFSAPGLNQNLKIRLYGLPLNENTKQMLRKKYWSRAKGIF